MRTHTSTFTGLLMVVLISITGACDGRLGQDCDGLQEEARALVKSRQGCSPGDSCVIVQMGDFSGGSCLGAFLCSTAVNADADLDAFGAQASALNDDYDGCPMCVMAGCINPAELSGCCDVETGQCVLDTGGGLCPSQEAGR